METYRDPQTEHIDEIQSWHEFLDVLDAWENTTRTYWDADPTPAFYSQSGRYSWWATILAKWALGHSNVPVEPMLEITRMIQAKDPLGHMTAFTATPEQIDSALQRFQPYRQILIDEALKRVDDPLECDRRQRIIVSCDPPQVTVDLLPTALTSDEAACLKAVMEYGDWITGAEIRRITKIARPDRAIRGARKKLGRGDFLEVTNSGTRVKPEWLT